MKQILKFVIPLVILLALVGWRIETKTAAKTALNNQSKAARSAPAVVATTVAKAAMIDSNVTAVGTIESPYQVKLSPNISGRIDYLQVREGDPVHAGEVLARIDPEYVEAQILQAQGNLAGAQQKYVQAKVTEQANTVTILNAINSANATVASTAADMNEAEVTYQHSVGAAHQAVLAATATVSSAYANVQSSKANLNLAEANLEDASAKYTRTYNLYSQGFDSAQDLDDQKAAMKVDQATVNSYQKIVEATESTWKSDMAQEQAAAHQEQITIKLGLSTIEDDKAKWKEAKQALATAVAEKSQIPAYTESLKALWSEVVAAQAALKQAIAQRTYLIVKSSIDGTVTQRLFDPGAEAVPGSPILVVQAKSPLFMTSSLPVEDSQYVHSGMDMRMQVDALPGRSFHLKLKDVNLSADPTSRQFMIRAVVDNSDGSFRPGMYCRVQLTTTSVPAAVTVPREAVKTDSSNSSTVTLVDKNDVAHIVPVTVGVQDANNIQILSGLKDGDRVVVLSYRAIADGAKVQEGSWQVVKQKGGKPIGQGGPNTNPSANLANSPSMAGGDQAIGTTGGGGGPSSGGAAGAPTGVGGAAPGGGGGSVPGGGANAAATGPGGTASSNGATGSSSAGTTGTASSRGTAPGTATGGTPGTAGTPPAAAGGATGGTPGAPGTGPGAAGGTGTGIGGAAGGHGGAGGAGPGGAAGGPGGGAGGGGH